MILPTKELHAALMCLAPIARMRSSQVSAGLVKIECTGNHIQLTVCCVADVNIWMMEQLPCEADTVLACMRFDYLLNALADGENTSLEFTEKSVHIVCGSHSSNLPTLLAEEYFKSAPNFESMARIGVPLNDLAEGIQHCWGFQHSERIPLTCLHLVGSNNKLRCEASTGLLLACWERDLITAPFDCLIEGKAVDQFIEGLRREGAEFRVSPLAVGVFYGGYIHVQQIETPYPSVQLFLDAPSRLIGRMDIKVLLAELKRLQVYFEPSNAPAVDLQFTASKLNVTFQASSGEIKFSIAGKFESGIARANCQSMIHDLQTLIESEAEIFLAANNRTIEFRQTDFRLIVGLMERK